MEMNFVSLVAICEFYGWWKFCVFDEIAAYWLTICTLSQSLLSSISVL